MEFLQHLLLEEGVLSLREVLRLLLLSGLFTVACVTAFPRNAPTRRVLLLAAVTALTVLPWLLLGMDAVWLVVLEDVPAVTLSAVVPNALLLLWLGIALILVLQHIRAVRQEVRSLLAQPQIVDARVADELSNLARALDITVPDLRLGNSACSTTLGELPTLVLPHNWIGWDDNTLRSVLAHELIHIQRRDDQWLLLTRLLVLVYWWMPWLIWLYRGYVRVMEESCDDGASELMGHQLSYVGGLVDAAKSLPRHEPSYVTVTNLHEHHLVGRVGRFADMRVVELDTSGVYWCVMGILVFVIGLSGIEPVLAGKSNAQADAVYISTDGPANNALSKESARAADLATYPEIYEHIEVPAHASAIVREQLDHPAYQPAVIYPGHAIRQGLEGNVVVEFDVNTDGSIANPNIVVSFPAKVFDASAIRAVQQTRYHRADEAIAGSPDSLFIRRVAQDPQVTKRTTKRTAKKSTHKPPQKPMRIQRHFHFRLDTR